MHLIQFIWLFMVVTCSLPLNLNLKSKNKSLEKYKNMLQMLEERVSHLEKQNVALQLVIKELAKYVNFIWEETEVEDGDEGDNPLNK